MRCALLSLLMLASACGRAPDPRAAAIAQPPARDEPRPDVALETPRGAFTVELELESAAFAHPGAPSVIVHASDAFDPARPLRLVVFLHGWSGCARMLVDEGAVPCRDGERTRDGWGLGARFDAAESDALFVVPQLALMARDGSPGRFLERGRFRAFLEEMLRALAPQIGEVDLAEVSSVTLLAHSAGFETALAILSRGEVEVRHVVLFDALYRGVEPFAAWVAERESRRLVSLYTGTTRTAQQSVLLATRARALLSRREVAADPGGSLADAVRAHRVVVARSPASHGSVPSRHIPELLPALGLSARPEVHSSR